MSGTMQELRGGGPNPKRVWSVATSFGSVLAAFIASLCCVGPLILALLGFGGAGLLLRFEPYRPWFTVLTLGLLGGAYYFTCRKPKVASRPSAATEECACEQPRSYRTSRLMLWIATVLVAGMLLFPYLVRDRASAVERSARVTASLAVEGMTCASCSLAVRAALERIDGVGAARVSVAEKRAVVHYEPAKVKPRDLVHAVNKLGYRARLAPK